MDTQTRANELIEKANELQNAGRGVAAAPLYIEAADLFPPYSSFKLVAADTLMKYEQWQDAADAYQGVLDEHPDHDQARDGLGDVAGDGVLDVLGRGGEATPSLTVGARCGRSR